VRIIGGDQDIFAVILDEAVRQEQAAAHATNIAIAAQLKTRSSESPNKQRKEKGIKQYVKNKINDCTCNPY